MRAARWTLVALPLLVACGTDTTGPGLENPEAEAPEARYDVIVTARHIDVPRDTRCDGTTLISKEPRDAEFQYRIEFEAGARFESMESEDYGRSSGRKYSRRPGERIDFANRAWKVRDRRKGSEFTIRFYATEWDGLERDSRLANHRAVDSFTLGTNVPTTRQEWALYTGASNLCGLELAYFVEFIRVSG